jgi:hypothetical protein
MASLLAAGMAAAQTSGGYRVAGVVLNDATGQPVAGARVTLASVERRDLGMSTATGDNGRFAFTGLPRGKYELSGRRRGLLPESYGQRAGWSSAIVTGPGQNGQNTESLVLRLPPPGIISGRVTDDAGEPVAEALVELLDSRITDGRRTVTAVSSKRTDDAGEYRWAGGGQLLSGRIRGALVYQVH